MVTSNGSPNTRSIFFYFGALTLLVYLVAPISTRYTDVVHAEEPSARYGAQVSLFSY